MYFYAVIDQAYPHEVICDERSYKVFLHNEVLCHTPQGKGDLYAALVIVADEVQHRHVFFPFEFSEASAELLDKDRLRIDDFEFTRNRILWSYRKDAPILAVPKSAAEVHNYTGKKRGAYKKGKH